MTANDRRFHIYMNARTFVRVIANRIANGILVSRTSNSTMAKFSSFYFYFYYYFRSLHRYVCASVAHCRLFHADRQDA